MRRLVVCADGTWKSELDADDATNVQLLREAVLPTGPDGTVQLATYLPGVGTRRFERLQGGAFGVGLSDNVKAGYRWLVEHVEDTADELYLFGFSRGAFTVRSLAGLVRNVGVLRPDAVDLVDEAYGHYRDRSPAWRPDGADAVAFRAAYAREPQLRCIGVWDTVGHLGVPLRGPFGWLSRRRYGFHDVTLSSRVRYGFQALAIDERRGAFPPTLWQADAAGAAQQTVEQVWFAGVHSNIGGGYPRSHVSDVALAWMAQRVATTGLALDLPSLPPAGPELCEAELADSRTGVYRLEPPHVRRLGADPQVTPDGRTLLTYEAVHESVAERRRACTAPPTGPYDPANLADYLRRSAAAGGQVAPPRQPADDLPTVQSGPRPSDR